MASNPNIRPLPAPGPHVTTQRCACGAEYRDHRGSYGFAEAARYLREVAKGEGDDGGGFRSRGPVLWVLRCLKINDWYMTHAMCGRSIAEEVPF